MEYKDILTQLENAIKTREGWETGDIFEAGYLQALKDFHFDITGAEK